MAVINTFKAIEDIKNKINSRYTIYSNNIEDILLSSDDRIKQLLNSFRFGSAQGMKAAKKEIKKGDK